MIKIAVAAWGDERLRGGFVVGVCERGGDAAQEWDHSPMMGRSLSASVANDVPFYITFRMRMRLQAPVPGHPIGTLSAAPHR